MSITLMSEVWRRQISGTQAMVLLMLADYARDDGSKVYPAVKTMAYKCSKSPRQIKRILEQLRRRGVLVVVRQGTGRGKSTHYRIDLAVLTAKGKPPRENDD